PDPHSFPTRRSSDLGPNGSGKSTLWSYVLEPELHAYEAAAIAAARRQELIATRRSFVTETVFSHESKIELVRIAVEAGYLVTLHVAAVPEALAVDRVEN